MATVASDIAALRLLINKYDDDSSYTDQALFYLLSKAGNLMNKRRFDSFDFISDWEYTFFCVEFEKKKKPPCDCVGMECYVLKSTIEIPEPVDTPNKSLFEVRDFNDNRIGYTKNFTNDKLHPIRGSRTLFSIENKKIIIHNPPTYDGLKLKVGAIWRDISEWQGLDVCSTGDTDISSLCFDTTTANSPLPDGYEFMAYTEILRVLGYRLKTSEVQSILTNNNHPN